MPKDYYECTGPQKTLIFRAKRLLWKIMLPVIGMTGFAIALGLLGLFLTPDSNGSYTALSLSDRLRVAVKKATPKAQPSASYNPIETDAAGNYASPKEKVKIKPFGKDHDLSRSDAIRCRDDFAFSTFGISELANGPALALLADEERQDGRWRAFRGWHILSQMAIL